MNKDNYMNQLLNKVFFTFILLGFCAFTFAQTIQVLNIPDTNRGTSTSDVGYHLNGISTSDGSANMINAKEKLTNTANFGSVGTIPHAINIVDGFANVGSITSVSALNGYDIIYVGVYVRTSGASFTASELSYLLQWSKQPGKVLMLQEQSLFSPVSAQMGYSILNGSNTNPTTAISNDVTTGVKMFSGVFGTVSSTGINQRGTSQGYFSGDCKGIPLARNANGKSTVIFNTEYRDVLIADTDYFTRLYCDRAGTDMSTGSGISTNADKAWANLWAWAVSEVVNKVNPGATTATGEVYTNQTLPLCIGDAVVLSLRNYNTPIIRWQTSTNGGSSWTNIASTNSTIVYPNPQNNQRFRAVLGNTPECPEILSPAFAITTKTCATGCNEQTAQMAAYNNQNNTSQIFTNNVIGIGGSRMSVSHVANGGWTITPNRISDTHYAGEFGINLGHNTTATSYATRLATTINFSSPVKDLKFTINNMDHSERFRIYAYDSNNNLLPFGTNNFDLHFGSVVTYNSSVGTTGEFQTPSTRIDSNTRFGTVDFKFNGVAVSRIVVEFYDTLQEGSFTIAKFSGVSELDCPTVVFDPCAVSATNPDTDGDGIADACDLDDDNDGILDTFENTCVNPNLIVNGNFASATSSSATSWTTSYASSPVTSGPINYTSNRMNVFVDNIGNLYAGNIIAANTSSFTMVAGHQYNFTSTLAQVDGTTNVNFSWVLIDSSNNIVQTIATYKTVNSGSGTTLITSTLTAYPVTFISTLSGTYRLALTWLPTNSANPGNAHDVSFDNIELRSFFCDLDGDGIPNNLDLDSDNDGCPDAIEGGANITTTVASAGTLQGGNTGTTSGTYNQPILLNLGNTVNTNAASTSYGVPTAAGAGQSVGTSQTANTVITTITAGNNQTINSGNSPAAISLIGTTTGVGIQWQVSTDNSTFTNIATSGTGTSYSPGTLTATRYYRALLTSAGGCTATTNVVTITVNQYCYENPGTSATTKPVKHGITVLGRAGKTGANGNTNDWPMVRNSAYTVLEGKTKGFVITRIANPETAITDPKIGMMVFDTDADLGKGCLKINTDGTSTGWKCFTKQSCP